MYLCYSFKESESERAELEKYPSPLAHSALR
jgi:hypothetical protein